MCTKKYLVFDWETSSKNKGDDYVGKASEKDKRGGPSPYHPLNTGVSVGWTTGGTENYAEMYGFHEAIQVAKLVRQGRDSAAAGVKYGNWYEQGNVLVGHNIRFDLLYTMKHYPDFEEWFWRNDIDIWDTQHAEYLLSGQTVVQPSLADSCTRHGLDGKIDAVSEMFKAGVQAQDIDPDVLLKYMKQDVLQTEELYLEQVEIAKDYGMTTLIESQMRAIRATFSMYCNGMAFDRELAMSHANRIQAQQELIITEIHGLYSSMHPKIPSKKISAGSNDFLSRALFGGSYKYSEKILTGEFYKNGKPKTKVTEFSAPVDPLLPLDTVPSRLLLPVKKAGYYEVNDDVLKKLTGYSIKADNLLKLVTKYRNNNKDLSTYYIGFSDVAWPREGQHFIHGNLNHSTTSTGRLSSSKPNLQNLSGKERD